MRQKSGPEKQAAEDAIRDIRRATRRHFSDEEKIRIVLEGLCGEESIAELCRRCLPLPSLSPREPPQRFVLFASIYLYINSLELRGNDQSGEAC
jgi:hypothetical protein